jgi:hypothetical protein
LKESDAAGTAGVKDIGVGVAADACRGSNSRPNVNNITKAAKPQYRKTRARILDCLSKRRGERNSFIRQQTQAKLDKKGANCVHKNNSRKVLTIFCKSTLNY